MTSRNDYLSDVRSEKALSSMVISEMDSQIRSLRSYMYVCMYVCINIISIVTSSQPLLYGLAKVT